MHKLTKCFQICPVHLSIGFFYNLSDFFILFRLFFCGFQFDFGS